MPKIYEYMGIEISFWSNEHEPIHVHARYAGSEVVVSLHKKDGRIYRTTYKPQKGKFPVAKMRELKKFISLFKETIVVSWQNKFIWGIDPQLIKITKKI